ncbi:MAG: ABC transporter permease [Armatimonadota bacterium]
MALWSDNPILAREVALRLSFRRHSPAQRKAGLAAVAIAVPLLYATVLWGARDPRIASDIRPLVVGVLETALLALFAPILAASAFTLEREKQTWNALLLTRLKPAQIVLGKYLGSLSPAAVVYACFLPLNAALAARAGLSLGRFLTECVALAATTAMFGAVGLFCSWACRRTQAANAATTLALVAILGGPWLLLPLWMTVAAGSFIAERFVPLWGNAFLVMCRLAEGPTFATNGTHDVLLPATTATYLAGAAALTAFCLLVPIARLADGPDEMVH